MSLEIQYLT